MQKFHLNKHWENIYVRTFFYLDIKNNNNKNNFGNEKFHVEKLGRVCFML